MSHEGLIFKRERVHTTQSKKKKNPIKKKREDLNRYFSKEDIQMASRDMKRCSTLLIIRKIQTMMRYIFTPDRIANIKITNV